MKKVKIVVLDGYTLNPGDLSWEGLEELGECIIYDRTSPEQVVERSNGATILLTNKTHLTGEYINQLSELKYIGVLATGYNVVDIKTAEERGVVVTNIPAYSTNSVAQMVFAHILTITQRVEHYTSEIREGKWTNSQDFSFWDTPLLELDGLTLGIVGFGNIGQAVAKIANGFGLRIIAYTSKAKEQLPTYVNVVSLEKLFKSSDIVTLHCPLTPETENLIDMESLSLMKKEAILINTGRGPLVNEKDLADDLNRDIIYAAGIDVLSLEPPTEDNPLLKAKNCFITPHIAWATKASRERLMKIMIGNLKAFLKGSVRNRVAL